MQIRNTCGWLWAVTLGVAAWVAAAEGPERFETEVQRFEQADRHTSPPRAATLFVGSSSLRLWTNLPAAFPQRTVLNRGFGGSTMNDLLHYYDRLVRRYQPRALVIYEGDNDLANGQTADQVLAAYRAFLDRVQRDQPGTPVILLAVKPSPSRLKLFELQRELNAGLTRLATERAGVVFADTFTPMLDASGAPDPQWFLSDQLHLSPAGYDRWIPVITAALTQADTLAPAVRSRR